MNITHILGRIGQDPELRSFPDGGKLVNLSVATDESYKDKEGNRVDKTEWHNVIFNGKLAEVIAGHFRKGQRIQVTGKLRTRQWEKDGVKHWTTEIVGSSFEFIEPKASGQQSQTADTPAAYGTHVAGTDDDGSGDLPF